MYVCKFSPDMHIISMQTNHRGTSTIGPQNQPELPSNQSLCYNYTSRVPEEQNVIFPRKQPLY